jgi:YD repeat-containing protein
LIEAEHEVRCKRAREIATQYVWGTFNLLEQVIDAKNNIVKVSYDTLGRVSTTTDPDRGNKTLTFDAFGDLVSIVDPKGTTTFTPADEPTNTCLLRPGEVRCQSFDGSSRRRPRIIARGRETRL